MDNICSMENVKMGSGRILIVDDTKTQRLVLEKLFKKEGFDVITAADGIEGVSQVFMNSPDIIVSDIQMPELNGYQFCRLIKNNRKTCYIPVILLSSLNQPQNKFWGMSAGADLYIVKSNDLAPLKDAVKDLLLKKTDLSSDGKRWKDSDKELDIRSIKSSVNQILDKFLFELTLSNEARKLTGLISNRNKLMEETASLIESLVEYSCLCISVNDYDGIRYYFSIKEPLSSGEVGKAKGMVQAYALNSSKGKKDMAEEYIFRSDLNLDDNSPVCIKSKTIVPLEIHNECIGYVSVFLTEENRIRHESEGIISLLARELSMTVKLMLLYEETKRLSITDNLTVLYNNRYFNEALEREFTRAKRYKGVFSLLMIDVDYFKKINDCYGHIQGDYVLRGIADILKDNIRKEDIVARYGGEEFAVLAVNQGIDGAKIVAERLRKKVEDFCFSVDGSLVRLSISIGVAVFDQQLTDKEGLVKLADDALYVAKNGGRNRVCLAVP